MVLGLLLALTVTVGPDLATTGSPAAAVAAWRATYAAPAQIAKGDVPASLHLRITALELPPLGGLGAGLAVFVRSQIEVGWRAEVVLAAADASGRRALRLTRVHARWGQRWTNLLSARPAACPTGGPGRCFVAIGDAPIPVELGLSAALSLTPYVALRVDGPRAFADVLLVAGAGAGDTLGAAPPSSSPGAAALLGPLGALIAGGAGALPLRARFEVVPVEVVPALNAPAEAASGAP